MVSKHIMPSIFRTPNLLNHSLFVDSELASELVPAVVAPGGSGSSASCKMPQMNAGEYTLKLSMNSYSFSGALKVCE